MANSKISALTSASTPLAGTETLPIVQSGATKQVSVANLTAGRAVSADTVLQNINYTTARAASAPTYGGNYYIYSGSGLNASVAGIEWQYATAGAGYGFKLNVNGGPDALEIGHRANSATWTVDWQFKNDGNLVPVTAAKGINFTANTPASGMTSQLLNWYEEGTWTPTYSGWTTSPTTANAKYTRVGRLVTLHYIGNNGISVAGVSSIGGLPFTSNSQQGASVAMKDISGAAPGVTCFATIASNATSISSMTTATFTGLYWAFSTTYMV